MTQPRRIFWPSLFPAAVLVFLSLSGAHIYAQLGGGGPAPISVTPTLAPLPPGQLITVNNGPGDHFDPHVSGDLVSYSNFDTAGCQSIHYFNLATMSDATVPFDCISQDFLSDVGGSVVAFTGVDNVRSAIFAFDSANPGAAPVELAPQANSFRQAAQVGDSTIAWQDYGFLNNGIASDIAAYDRASGTVTRLTSDGHMNQTPAISPDGRVITWADCQTFTACDIWSATGGGGNWSLHQLTNGNNGGGLCSRSDTDGQIVVYSCNRLGKDSIFWQPVAGGTEQVLDFAGSSINPAVSGGLISFANEAPGAVSHNIFVFDTSTANLYQITNATNDTLLNDIAATPDGKVRVVWEIEQIAINAYTFSLPGDESSISNLIGALLGAGCIDNAGIATALTSKLSAAQAAGNTQTAINTLTALKNQIQAQSGKHIASTCTISGVAFDPVTVLLAEVQRLIDSLRVSLTPDPITGSVVDSNGVGLAGATVSLVDGGGNTVATAFTDITGFYFIATTGGILAPGANYSLAVSGLPAGFSMATPANQMFQWQQAAVSFSDFVLN